MPEQPTAVHDACPQGHRYAYVTSKGFGWCKACQRHSPATLDAEAALEGMRARGEAIHPRMDTDRNGA